MTNQVIKGYSGDYIRVITYLWPVPRDKHSLVCSETHHLANCQTAALTAVFNVAAAVGP